MMAQVNVTNITVNVNNFQSTYNNLGLGPIPAGTTVSDAVSKIQSVLSGLLVKQWPASFPSNDAAQEDSAIMAPWSANVPGSAPDCVTQAIGLDFKNWDLPSDNGTITSMAQEITQQISNHGGEKGTFYGQTKIASSRIYWGVAFASSIVVDNPEELGIIYAFTAVVAY